MRTLDSTTSATYAKDNSTFIAYLMPIESFEDELSRLKIEHKKAVHFVRASRHFNEFNQIVESFSDDGEPKGSSGTPVLNVMRGHELINCAIIVVRYFGGKLLGVGGLVRAYSAASLAVIAASKLIDFIPLNEYSLNLAPNKINRFKYLCKNLKVEITHFEFRQNFAIIRIKTSAATFEKLRAEIN